MAFRPTDWERRTPVRPGLSAARNAAVAREIAPHWGAALPVAGIMIEAKKSAMSPAKIKPVLTHKRIDDLFDKCTLEYIDHLVRDMKLPQYFTISDIPDDGPCRLYFDPLIKDFEASLADTLSQRTIRKHIFILAALVDFLCFDCGVRNFDDLTVGMVNSGFRRWFASKIGSATEGEVKTAVRKFFLFLAKEKGFANEKILRSQQPK
ncbi:hypothetical protein [Candidatus Thiodictyon syntrophicum]|uniref:hypothetical protein n=1 Tax=Candidatus Thiodictyon syntrophicum TaxID=1166950 RepID=UPI0012FD4C5C|nr:hypothetical protein [Candidatus Thiodictyon syntrophicum]